MTTAFSRSMRSLERDRGRGPMWAMAVGTLLIALWGAWLIWGELPLYQVSQSCRLEVVQASHRLQAPVAGRVARSRLTLGNQVQRGDILVELEARAQRLALAEMRTRHSALTAELAALEAEVVAAERSVRVARAADRMALHEAQAREREVIPTARFATDKAERLQKMHGKGGSVAELEMLEARAEAQRQKASANTLRLAKDRLRLQQRGQQTERRLRVEGLGRDTARLRGEAAVVIATIERLEHAVEQRRIRAPVSGTLGDVADLRVGGYLEAGQGIGTVVPEGDLKIVAEYGAAAIGRIRPGQPARASLDGFPWTQYGHVKGKVRSVGRDTHGGTVRVELTVETASASRIPLQHGLPGSVEVEVERVTPATVLLRAAGKLIAPTRQIGGDPS